MINQIVLTSVFGVGFCVALGVLGAAVVVSCVVNSLGESS